MRIVFILLIFSLSLFAVCNGNAQFEKNLILGGSAENASDLNHWITESGYGFSRFPYSTNWAGTPPPDAGLYAFFADDTPETTVYQDIDVCNLASQIDLGVVHYKFSGYHGGYGDGDNIELKVIFLNSNSTKISEKSTGPYTSNKRMDPFALKGYVPRGTRKIRIKQIIKRKKGNDADGYSDELKLILWSDVVIDYRLDECWWDNNNATYEIQNYGYIGNSRNATALNGANIGQINDNIVCRNGNIVKNNKALLIKNGLSLQGNHTLMLWIKFPLDESDHKIFYGKKFFNIADLKGYNNDYIYFKKNIRNNKWKLCVFGNQVECKNFNPQSFSGWHHVSFVIENRTTKVYIDGNLLLQFNQHPNNGVLGLIANSDYDIRSNPDNNPNSQSLGAYIDEFKIFRRTLTQEQIRLIYNNEKNGKNYDGTPRVCESCQLHPVLEYRLDECEGVDTVKDSSGNGLDGTLVYSPSFSEARVCRGVDLDGKHDYIQREDNDLLDGTQSLSILFWFNARTLHNPDSNARGILAKRMSSRNNDAYSAFFWNGNNMPDHDHAKLYVDWDNGGSGRRVHTERYFYKDHWYFVTIVFDGRYPQQKRLKIYVNGEFDSEHPLNTTFLPNYASDLFIGNLKYGSIDKLFDGIIDEVKIAREPLHSQLIKRIYERELAGKNWWDGGERVCPLCQQKEFLFNAVSFVSRQCEARQDWENNLSTQVVKKPFSIYVLSKDKETNESIEANITKVSLYYYASGGTQSCSGEKVGEKVLCEGNCGNTNEQGCSKALSVTVDEAHRCIQVYVEGKELNSSTSETNSSISIDNFAIRPDHFEMTIDSTQKYAEENFTIDFAAIDGSGGATKDYNATKSELNISAQETKVSCKSGTISVGEFQFFDGKAKDVAANYSEIGDINITIAELNGSEFAEVDKDDTPDTQRFIKPASKVITVLPYEINVIKIEWSQSTDTNWLYMARNITDMNVTLKYEVNVTNKTGDPMEDFNATCYGHDIDLKFHYDYIKSDGDDEHNLTLWGDLLSFDTALDDINKTVRIPVSRFSGGKGSGSYAFGIDRNYSRPQSPIFIQLKNLTIQNTSYSKEVHSAKERGLIQPDFNATFFYGRIKPNDLTTSKVEDNTSAHILVYDRTGNFTKDRNQTILNWYLWDRHSGKKFGEVRNAAAFRDTTMSQSADMEVAKSDPVNGRITFTITKHTDTSGYIHLDISPWLWFSYDEGAAYDATSDCVHHPCIKYDFFASSPDQVQSGEVTGVRFDQNVSKQRRSLKVFR